MKRKYNREVILRCSTCGDSNFEYNENKTWVKCNHCGREYNGGYDELQSLNQDAIQEEVKNLESDVLKDAKSELFRKIKRLNKK